MAIEHDEREALPGITPTTIWILRQAIRRRRSNRREIGSEAKALIRIYSLQPSPQSMIVVFVSAGQGGGHEHAAPPARRERIFVNKFLSCSRLADEESFHRPADPAGRNRRFLVPGRPENRSSSG